MFSQVSNGVKIIFIGICGGRLLLSFAVRVHVLVNTQNVMIHVAVLQETANARTEPLFC